MQSNLDDKANMVYSYYFLGTLARKQERFAQAREWFAHTFRLLASVANKSLLADTLEALAQVHADERSFARAARLFGAGHALRTAIDSPLMPHECSDYDATLAAIRASLDDSTFDREWRQGATAPLGAVIADETACAR